MKWPEARIGMGHRLHASEVLCDSIARGAERCSDIRWRVPRRKEDGRSGRHNIVRFYCYKMDSAWFRSLWRY